MSVSHQSDLRVEPSAPPDTAGPPAWAPEVLAFAQEAGVADYLEPLLKETRRLFPAGRAPRVKMETDPEIEDDRHIVWEVDAPFTGTKDYLKSQKAWIEALCQVCPAPLTCLFRFLLLPVPHESA